MIAVHFAFVTDTECILSSQLDAQCKLFRELLSFQEQCELLVKEISAKLGKFPIR